LRRRLVVLSLLALAVGVIGACGPTVMPAPSESPKGDLGEAVSAVPTISYQMVQVKTRTPTPGPATPKPTATFVPLITPSATTYKAPAANAAAGVPRISLSAAKRRVVGLTLRYVRGGPAPAYEQRLTLGAV